VLGIWTALQQCWHKNNELGIWTKREFTHFNAVVGAIVKSGLLFVCS